MKANALTNIWLVYILVVHNISITHDEILLHYNQRIKEHIDRLLASWEPHAIGQLKLNIDGSWIVGFTNEVQKYCVF